MKTGIDVIPKRRRIRNVVCAYLLWLPSAAILKGQINPALPADVLEQKAKLEEDAIIRVSVDEVRIDAVILDWRGRQITDLTADDFGIHQDGRRQEIISCIYKEEQYRDSSHRLRYPK